MRVIAGKFGSRTLKGPRGLALRPTSDRLRETLFNILGAAVENSVFVDVYAGTGAVGIEALSRGAKHVVFIESHKTAVALIRRNFTALGIAHGADILPIDAAKGLALLAKKNVAANFIFLDPPYAGANEYARMLETLNKHSLMAAQGIVVLEHDRRLKLNDREGKLARVRVVEQGDAVLSFYAMAS
jgi:16S rRNA (guanine(966)-N(2))-methyltransferase RsmD